MLEEKEAQRGGKLEGMHYTNFLVTRSTLQK
jgi:hypothetical protein